MGYGIRTSLMLAAEKGHTETVRRLLDGGADVQAKNSNGWTALLFAAWKGHIPVVFLLLDHHHHQGGAVDAKECRIACMYAAAEHHIELFEVLYRFCRF
jgi:uncharacterized protein